MNTPTTDETTTGTMHLVMAIETDGVVKEFQITPAMAKPIVGVVMEIMHMTKATKGILTVTAATVTAEITEVITASEAAKDVSKLN